MPNSQLVQRAQLNDCTVADLKQAAGTWRRFEMTIETGPYAGDYGVFIIAVRPGALGGASEIELDFFNLPNKKQVGPKFDYPNGCIAVGSDASGPRRVEVTIDRK